MKQPTSHWEGTTQPTREDFKRAVIDDKDTGSLVVDVVSGKIVYFSPRLVHWFGYAADEVENEYGLELLMSEANCADRHTTVYVPEVGSGHRKPGAMLSGAVVPARTKNGRIIQIKVRRQQLSINGFQFALGIIERPATMVIPLEDIERLATKIAVAVASITAFLTVSIKNFVDHFEPPQKPPTNNRAFQANTIFYKQVSDDHPKP